MGQGGMKFLADMGISLRTVQWLRDQGFDTVHLSCCVFRLHGDFSESFVTRGLSPLPMSGLDD